MKTKLKFISVFLLFYIGVNIIPQKTFAQVSVNFQVFYDELSPYGNWVERPDYGYVWIPDVDPGFTPYATNGYWVFTDDGWTWVSNYSWGWAPFHYGRWYTDPTYGPMWIPDNEWGPGWVTWRRSSDYYGWAPMGPGISIDIAYGNGYNERYNNYTFVRGSHFGKRDINNYYVNTTNNVTIINNTTVINNTRIDHNRNVRYNAGPDRTEVERHSGRRIAPVTIKERSKPGQNLSKNQLQIYRPRVEKNTPNGQRIAPGRVSGIKDVKTRAQRTANTPQQKANQQERQQRNVQPAKQKQSQQQRNVQPTRQQPSQQQRNVQPTRQQPSQQQRNVQPTKQQPSKQQRNVQPTRQQPAQQQRNVQPTRQQPAQQQRNVQPTRQQPSQQQRNVQPARQQPTQQQRNIQPTKQQPSQQQRNVQPAKQQPSQPVPKNKEKKNPH